MAAKRFLNLVESGNALVARLPIPEHDKTLTANTAVGFRISVCGLAEYLHVITSRKGEAFLSV
jgi:hypothetical protein